MGAIASFLIKMKGKAAAKRFEAATMDPAGTQQRKLMELMERNKDTEYGKANGFAGVKRFRDYQERVPVIGYDDIRERMDRVVKGEKNIFTAEDPVMFNQTSGTTGTSKFIPVTPTCRGRDHSDQMSTWTYHALCAHPGIFRGQVVSMVSPAVEGRTESGIPFGSTSGVIYRDMPGIVKKTYALPYELFLVSDYLAKYYTLMRISLAQNITMVATANPSTILKMCEIADQHAEQMIKDIADGTLWGELKIDPAHKKVIEGVVKPNPGRARELEQMRGRRDGKLLPADYWPEIAMIGCWKGGTVGSYLEKFPGWFDPDRSGMPPVRDMGYLSSEFRGSIPLTDHGSAGVLTVNANVYEFVHVDELENHPHEKEAWTFLGVEDLVEDQEYYIFVTTTGGLYRYDINDVIEVVGKYNNTPTIIFKRKGRGMTNITGEKLSVNQVIEAFDKVSGDMGVAIAHYKAEADQEGSRYVFKVEAPALPPDRRRELIQRLDAELSRLNIEWEAKRKSLRLNDPLLHVMKEGWYERKKKALVAGGKRLFQAKTVLLDAKEGFQMDAEELEAEVTLENDD